MVHLNSLQYNEICFNRKLLVLVGKKSEFPRYFTDTG